MQKKKERKNEIQTFPGIIWQEMTFFETIIIGKSIVITWLENFFASFHCAHFILFAASAAGCCVPAGQTTAALWCVHVSGEWLEKGMMEGRHYWQTLGCKNLIYNIYTRAAFETLDLHSAADSQVSSCRNNVKRQDIQQYKQFKLILGLACTGVSLWEISCEHI